jgi:hypothetical protein
MSIGKTFKSHIFSVKANSDNDMMPLTIEIKACDGNIGMTHVMSNN